MKVKISILAAGHCIEISEFGDDPTTVGAPGLPGYRHTSGADPRDLIERATTRALAALDAKPADS